MRECQGGDIQGLSAQPAPSVRPDLLLAGKGPVPAGGYPGPLQRQHSRIYTVESGLVHARQLERMGLIIT